jgi:HAD superfamily hydrolase (TIGR01459 family)
MRIEGLSEIADQFDGMLIDQFGVIHDGMKLYSGTLEVMKHLRTRNIPVVVMTNSGKRNAANRKRLLKIGLEASHFADVQSSGELAFESLKSERVYIIGKRGEDYGYYGANLTEDPDEAELFLIMGSNAPETSLDEYANFFKGRNQPALCCNPDKLMLTSQGRQPAPGAIAEIYQKMGGQVRWLGKPYPEIYHAAAARIGNPKRILCIGDSAEHDVAGGQNAGFQTLLVLQGVSKDADPDKIEPRPDYVMAEFRW